MNDTIELPPGISQAIEFILQQSDKLRRELRSNDDIVRQMLQEFAVGAGLEPSDFTFDRELRALRRLRPIDGKQPPASSDANIRTNHDA